MRRLTELLTARATSWIVLVAAFLLTAAVFVLGSGSESESAPGVGLPSSAESVRVGELQKSLPSADSTSAILAFARDGAELDPGDLDAISAAATELSKLSSSEFVAPPVVSDDGTTALVIVPLTVETDIGVQTERIVYRQTINADVVVSVVLSGN